MKTLKTVLAVMSAALLFASCNGKKDDPVKPEGPKGDVEIPEILFECFYLGDYNEAGTGNILLNLESGNVHLNDDETEYIGDGLVVCLDMNITLPETVEEADRLHLAAGTYTDGNSEYAAFTWNPGDSYVLKVENDVAVLDEVAFKSGTVVVTNTSTGVKIVVDGVLKNGTEFSYEYEGIDRIINHSDDSKYSNLDKNITVRNLVAASCSSLGDVAGDGKTETWVIALGDKYYDFESDYGRGESVMLYLNVAAGTDELPEVKVTEFADLNVAQTLSPNTAVGGVYMFGMYAGTWYNCPAEAYESAIAAGEFEISKSGDNEYLIKGELKDAYDHTVTFSYKGEVKLMEYQED